MENGKFTNPFSSEKAIKAAAFGRNFTQNAEHFVPIILHSAFSIKGFLFTLSPLP